MEKAFVRAAPTWDLDHDGVVTCEEWRQYAGRLFDEADKDHRGFVLPEDFPAIAAQDRLFDIADFKFFDTNGDGRVTRAEMVDAPNPAFRLMDKNHDCRLDNEELRVAYGGPEAPRPKSDGDGKADKRRGGG